MHHHWNTTTAALTYVQNVSTLSCTECCAAVHIIKTLLATHWDSADAMVFWPLSGGIIFMFDNDLILTV